MTTGHFADTPVIQVPNFRFANTCLREKDQKLFQKSRNTAPQKIMKTRAQIGYVANILTCKVETGESCCIMKMIQYFYDKISIILQILRVKFRILVDISPVQCLCPLVKNFIDDGPTILSCLPYYYGSFLFVNSYLLKLLCILFFKYN